MVSFHTNLQTHKYLCSTLHNFCTLRIFIRHTAIFKSLCITSGVNESVTQTLEMVKKFENIVSGKRLYALKKEENDLKSSVTLVDTSSEHDVVINNEFC